MLSFYEVDWQDVVRQCYDALRAEMSGTQREANWLSPPKIPRYGRSTTATTTRCRRPCCWTAADATGT